MSHRGRVTAGGSTSPSSRPAGGIRSDVDEPLPQHARVVVVGGGIAGASVAYHLANAGWTDVVLVEQNAIGGGTTWHAAGLVARIRAAPVLSTITVASARLYASLEAE